MSASPTIERMPVLFAGHGSPLNAISDNVWSRGFARLGELVPAPRAIVSVSAHWFVDGTFVTAEPAPRTIHDFYGFPEPLYALSYPAPGAPELAARVCALIEGATPRTDWGLDHGTWSVLRFMYPDAKVPVIQLSIDRRLPPAEHIARGRALAPLRDEGVLIFASGNVTHNLRDAMQRMRRGDAHTPEWAQRFDATVADVLARRDTQALGALWPESEDGLGAHPSPDHFFPLLYAYGASDERDRMSSPVQGFDLGSLSMRCVSFTPS